MAWFWIVFLLSPLILLYYTSINATAIWVWIWGVVWFYFVNSKADELTRGLIFIVASVFVAVVGKTMIGHTEQPETIEMVQNVMLLIGGGVGGNFMAAYMLKNHTTTSVVKKK